jgi:hypothetical protein
MALVIELSLDGCAAKAVRRVWDRVHEVTGSSALKSTGAWPHVTLAIYDEATAGEIPLRAAIEGFDLPPTRFLLDGAGVFPGAEGVAFLAPVADEALLRAQRRWHAAVPGSDPLYLPGAWVPHCTVGIGLDEQQLQAAVATARGLLPVRGRFEKIALVRCERRAPGPVQRLLERPLALAAG